MEKISIARKLKLFFIKLARARASTEEISCGAAIGTFISVFPMFGFGMPLVVLLGKFFKFNLIAALALSVVSNPFTSPFFMVLSYKIGSIVLGRKIEYNIENWKENLGDTGILLLIGSLIVSGLLSVVAYFTTKFVVKRYRDKKNIG
jgi:uncharacterized protein (DUF2062 family)